MSKAILILDAGTDTIKAIALSSPKLEPLGYVAVPFAPRHALGETLSAVFSAIREKAAVPFDKVYVSLHPSYMSLRVIDVPFQDRKKINEVLPFELEGLLPFAIEDTVQDSIPLGGGKALAIAVEKGFLKGYLDSLKTFKVDPAWIGSAYFSLPYLIEELYRSPSTKAFVCGDFISVSREGKPLFFNTFHGEAGLKLSLAYLQAESIKIDEIYSSGWDVEALKRITHVSDVREAALPGGLPAEGIFIFALAVQIKKGLLGETVNLRRGEFEYTKDKAAFRKRLKVTCALISVIAAVITGDAYIRYLVLKGEYAAYRDALRASYSELFPAERLPAGADELYQLTVKLKTLDRESEVVKGGFSPLDVMTRLARTASADPAMGIRLNDLHMAEGRVKASGEASSFEAANRFRDALAKDDTFKAVHLSDVRARTGGGAAFSLSINLN